MIEHVFNLQFFEYKIKSRYTLKWKKNGRLNVHVINFPRNSIFKRLYKIEL